MILRCYYIQGKKGTDLFIDPKIALTGPVDWQLVLSPSLSSAPLEDRRSRVNSAAKDQILGTKAMSLAIEEIMERPKNKSVPFFFLR